jgi:FKBP-type peptidyl-prolyl cis-trans isomerase
VSPRARLACALCALALAACRRGPEEPPPPTNFAPELGVDISAMERTASGLYIQTLAEGTGDPPRPGLRIGIEYKGWLVDGTPFDSTTPGMPQRVTLGEDFMVDGFMEGVQGIRMGEERLLVVKPDLGYGRDLVPDVPRGSWLVFRLKRVPPDRRPPPA